MGRFTQVFFKPGQEPFGDYKRYSMYTIVANGIQDTTINRDADLEITLFCDDGPGTPGVAKEAVFNTSSIAGFRLVPPDEE
ncbi:MAG: hypothetical protein ABR975_07810 [Vulcanimicrobiaceae bacterium]|jgi:hypothetical protein